MNIRPEKNAFTQEVVITKISSIFKDSKDVNFYDNVFSRVSLINALEVVT